MTNQIIKSFIIIFFLLSIIAGFFFDIGHYLSFETIKEQHEKLILLIESNFIFYFILFFFIYIIVTAFALPFAAIKTVLAGALFGLIPGVILTSVASSIGSTLCFLMSRFVFRDFVQNKYSKYLDKIKTETLLRYGVYQVEADGLNLFEYINGDQDSIMGLPIKQIMHYIKQYKK